MPEIVSCLSYEIVNPPDNVFEFGKWIGTSSSIIVWVFIKCQPYLMVIINLDVSNMNERRNFYRELGREVLHDPRRGGQCADTKSREPQLRSLAQDLARGDQKLRATHREGDKTLIINKGEGIHGLETCRGSPRSQGEHDDYRCRDGRWEHPEATSLIHEVI